MIHPVPPGTRDVLPDEMRELRTLSLRMHAVFEGAGYGEVWTPAIEYEDVLRRADDSAAGAGDAEVIALAIDALTEAGLRRHRVGLGDGMLYRTLLDAMDVPEGERQPLLESLWQRDLVQLEVRIDALGVGKSARELLVTLPTLRGGPEVLERVDASVGGALDNLRQCHELLRERGVADRVIFDLGLLRELGYYTGTIFEVYDPAVAFALGGGGRYDDLLGRFGEPRPACGAGLDIQRVHLAQLEEERLGDGARS